MIDSPRPPLAVGQRWRNREGNEAVVEQEDLSRPFDSDSRFRVRHSSGAVIWHGVDGKPNINEKGLELVELLSGATARQFKQITAAGDRLFALADDGTAWALHHSLPITSWTQLPSLPRPLSDAEVALVLLDDAADRLDAAHENSIRRALERLKRLEDQANG